MGVVIYAKQNRREYERRDEMRAYDYGITVFRCHAEIFSAVIYEFIHIIYIHYVYRYSAL